MNVILKPSAARYLERMNEPMKGKVLAGLRKLEQEPLQGDIRPFQGQENLYRCRLGNYRIVFEIMDDVIVVERIGPRGDVYKR